MRWLMDVCPNGLGWQTWLILCAVIVVLWAAAIACATALFHAAAPQRRSAAARVLRRLRSPFTAVTAGRTDASTVQPPQRSP
ncbi:hypothetical protein EV589_5736 [Mycobacterium sp. BK558]|uniref:hypothetical protein n=1 Tax=Mycolicibacterium sp. D5.8-2 TaxID=3085903 RepID=UPI0010F028AE|nr:hypothetical protein [Mycolicibacterium sp. D5.8-2]MDW5613898.1 hypothetical protein [Mycolicibacterium sp. D5.8-2]RZT11546.1 hypothetical protein EV589_5736 [Mycobacterium sp. BK558]